VRLPRNPYPGRELARFVWRMIAGPPPRPPGSVPVRTIVLAPEPPVRSLAFVGDILPLLWRDAEIDPAVAAFVGGCEAVVGNLEGILTAERWFPFLQKHTPRIFDVLGRVAPPARWVLGVANNHAPDYGAADFAATLRGIERAGMRWVGSAERPRLSPCEGVTLTAWTHWTNGPAPMVPLRDPGAPSETGVHIAYVHWGYEFERAPRPEQRALLPAGYALVVGHHSHLPQPLEALADGRVVAWSLGNWLTEVRLRGMGEGAVLRVDLAERAGAPVLARVEMRDLVLDRSDRRHCRLSFRV
jgi:hypothetical protein